jgi:SET domain-containing protein
VVAMDMSWFVNHGAEPNLEFARVPGQDFNVFRTIRHVRAGEELTYDYSLYAPDMHQRIVGGEEGGSTARRERLEASLHATEAAADQLRAELRALDSGAR